MSGMQALHYFAFWQAYFAMLEFYHKPGSRPRTAGEKRHLGWLRHYLVAATRGGQPSTAAGSAGAALHLYDLRNKLVAASLPLPEVGRRHILVET